MMKAIWKIALACLTVSLSAGASSERVIPETIGPTPESHSTSGLAAPSGAPPEGHLRIYTARRKQDIDERLVGYVANQRWDHVFFKAHTDYTLLTSDGNARRKVRNSRGANDGEPAWLELPAGLYQVRGEAEDFGADTFPITMTVRIEPGQTTTIYLSQEWEWKIPKTGANPGVRLPNGRVIGWRSAASLPSRERSGPAQ